ncbi:DUF416 family protein [Chamaesiphon polymorphus]|uniref:Uncharacterized protein n=1 Tax=Chamaesiphon polymorphus CCALA 037 TaxID=2107692 RepID=A0A2T1GD57_9CYAN|nr:DUF416 family protein [Chamaesiphon polymorphus]PSB55409.1 hypothetical protein C7B77_15080 [Chamaesiphon polymorphus CCALA 037]
MNLTAQQIIDQEGHLKGFFPFVEIAIDLKQLPFDFQIAFFASCYERALPIYMLVNGRVGWGDISILRSVGDDLWKIAGGMQIQEETIKNIICKVAEIFIEDDESDNEDDESDNYYAESRDGVIYVLIIEEFSRFIIQILNYIERDTPENYLQIFINLLYIMREYFSTHFPNIDPEWEFKKSGRKQRMIELNTAEMQAEICKELEDLDFLEKTPKLTPEILATFRANAACAPGMSILGSLDEVRSNLEW